MFPSRVDLHTVSVVDALTEALRARILDGSWAPGATVAEVDVAREFQVSRPTAKTAIHALVHERLLRHEANRPARVPQPTPEDVTDLFLVRTPLELAAADAVATLDESDRAHVVHAAHEAVRTLHAVPESAPHSEFVHADLSFHQNLVDAVGSPRLSRVYAGLRGEIHLCMVHTRRALGRTRIAHEHAAILDAVQTGDRHLTDRLMRKHLTGARETLIAVLTD